MSKKLFTPQEIEQLKQNEYVKSVSEKGDYLYERI